MDISYVNIHEGQHRTALLLRIPGCGIVGTPLQKTTKRPKWLTMKQDPSGVKRKRVAKDFNAEEVVIRLMEDKEFSAWCEKKTCQMTHLTKMTMKETSRRQGVGMLLTKCYIYSLFTASHCDKLRTIINGKSAHFPFKIVRVLYTFLQQFGRYNFWLIITLHDQKSLCKMGEKAFIMLGTQGI